MDHSLPWRISVPPLWDQWILHSCSSEGVFSRGLRELGSSHIPRSDKHLAGLVSLKQGLDLMASGRIVGKQPSAGVPFLSCRRLPAQAPAQTGWYWRQFSMVVIKSQKERQVLNSQQIPTPMPAPTSPLLLERRARVPLWGVTDHLPSAFTQSRAFLNATKTKNECREIFSGPEQDATDCPGPWGRERSVSIPSQCCNSIGKGSSTQKHPQN